MNEDLVKAPERLGTAAQLRLYETVLQATPDLVYVFDLQHRFIYANAALLAMWGCSWDDAKGKTFVQLGYESWHAAMHDAEIERVIATRAPVRGDVPFPHDTLGVRIYDYIFMPVIGLDGRVEAIAGSTRDVTERKHHEDALRQSEQRFSAMVNASSDLIYRMNPEWTSAEIVGGRAAHRQLDHQPVDWLQSIHPDDREHVSRAVADARRTNSPFEAEHRMVRADGQWAWVSSRAVPIQHQDGRIMEWFGSATDVSDRIRHEEHMRLLVNELNHRVKNTLALVQSMTLQTLRSCKDPGQAIERIESRLTALSDAHDILTRKNWEGVSVSEIVRTAIAPCIDDDESGKRFDIGGPPVMLDPRRAVALSMALHELCTNAMKYGSLSVPDGRVGIHWTRGDGSAQPEQLRLDWHESGGPVVQSPQHRGFGSRLIERGLQHDLGGEVKLVFSPDGVTCHIRAPLAENLQ